MAQQDRATLKGYFNTGDIPTQAQFADLIDSCFNLQEDNEWLDGKKLTNSANSDVYAQLVGSGPNQINLMASSASVVIDDEVGVVNTADTDNNLTVQVGGGSAINDVDSWNVTAPAVDLNAVNLFMGHCVQHFASGASGIVSPSATNNFIGTAQLSGGTKTVANTYVKTGAIIFCIWTGTGTQTTAFKQGAIVNGTSFVISTAGADTAEFNYIIFNPS